MPRCRLIRADCLQPGVRSKSAHEAVSHRSARRAMTTADIERAQLSAPRRDLGDERRFGDHRFSAPPETHLDRGQYRRRYPSHQSISVESDRPSNPASPPWRYGTTRAITSERQVRIDPGGKQQVMLNAIVAELDRTKLENQGIDLSVALVKVRDFAHQLAGQVATPYGPTSQLTGGTGAVPGVRSCRRSASAAAAFQHDDLWAVDLETRTSRPSRSSSSSNPTTSGASSRSLICSQTRVRARRFYPAVKFRSCSRRRSTPRSCSRSSAPRSIAVRP